MLEGELRNPLIKKRAVGYRVLSLLQDLNTLRNDSGLKIKPLGPINAQTQ